jgi:hypothetical protein
LGAGPVGGRAGLYWVLADGTQPAEPLVLQGAETYAGSWTPVGQLLFMPFKKGQSWDIWLLASAGGAWSGRELLATPALERDAQVSPGVLNWIEELKAKVPVR